MNVSWRRLLTASIPILMGMVVAVGAMAAVPCPPQIRLIYSDNAIAPLFLGDGVDIPEPPGLVVEWVRRVLARTGCASVARLSRIPISRMLHDMSDGSQDIVVGAAPTEERLRFLNFPLDDGKPDSGLFFTQAVLSFYTREDEQNVSWDGQVLRAANPIVGVVRNHVGETIGRAHGWSMDDATQVSQNIAKLRHGRFDVILQTSLEMTSDMEAENGLRKLMPPVAVINYYAPVSHQFFAAYPEFSKEFWWQLCLEGRAYFKSIQTCGR